MLCDVSKKTNILMCRIMTTINTANPNVFDQGGKIVSALIFSEKIA